MLEETSMLTIASTRLKQKYVKIKGKYEIVSEFGCSMFIFAYFATLTFGINHLRLGIRNFLRAFFAKQGWYFMSFSYNKVYTEAIRL